MANEDTKKKVVYSETIELDDLETENKALLETVDQLEEEKKLSDVHVRRMEEETVMLKELFNKWIISQKLYVKFKEEVEDEIYKDVKEVEEKVEKIIKK